MGEEERDLLLDAFASNWIAPLGPHLDAFERELADRVGMRFAVGVSSGTAALHLALVCLGVGPGDEVLVPSFTFAASANVVRYVGATPVFVDCSAGSWNVDPSLVEEYLRGRSRGTGRTVMTSVDLYGECCDYDALLALSDRFGLLLVEDAAEAMGATYSGRNAGTFGKAGVLSFNSNKIITSGGGGVLLTDDAALADRARRLSAQARQPVAHYQHEEIGYNYRLSNLLAAVGRGQLRLLDERVAARRAIRARYAAALGAVAGVRMMPLTDGGEGNAWLTCVTLDEQQFGTGPAQVRQHLARAGIEARPAWKPMHLQPVFRGCQVLGGSESARAYTTGLCLPSGSALTAEQQRRVVDVFLRVPGRQVAARW